MLDGMMSGNNFQLPAYQLFQRGKRQDSGDEASAPLPLPVSSSAPGSMPMPPSVSIKRHPLSVGKLAAQPGAAKRFRLLDRKSVQ